MNKLNDFIEIFGLNINAGDVVKDKHGNEYKLSREYKKQYHGHEDDDINDEEFDVPHICTLPKEMADLVFETEEDTLFVELYLSPKGDCSHA